MPMFRASKRIFAEKHFDHFSFLALGDGDAMAQKLLRTSFFS
jgi:hypothetical protein